MSVDSFYKPVLLPRTVIPSLSLKEQKLSHFGSFHSVLLAVVKDSEGLNFQC